MKVLLDTNIIIHRESPRIVNQDIGVLFHWLDKLHYAKYVHPVTIQELNKLKTESTRKTFKVKLDAYSVLQVQAPINSRIQHIITNFDKDENDRNDSLLLNELFSRRVDILITEDKNIHRKAEILSVADQVFTIDSFLEKVTAENPGLAEYQVLSVKKELFGNVNLEDEFFDSFREDYPGFDAWFNKKAEEPVYVCRSNNQIVAFLYLKIEDENEPYTNIVPAFRAKRRLKVGTFKVTMNGYKLGERFIKIIFDNALRYKVDEIYVTIFDKGIGQLRLINLFDDFGFVIHGIKQNSYGDEQVYVRNMEREFNVNNPKLSYPYFSRNSRVFLVPIYPQYHTELLPDSILRTESPADFVENEPFRNAISKVYISRSHFKDLRAGDNIVFYRTGGYYKSVVSTIGIVESVHTNIQSPQQFISLCRKRSVFSDNELIEHWNYYPNLKPFVVNFLYVYSFPKRINMQKLIELGVIRDVNSAPRGFEEISLTMFEKILQETQTDECFIVD